MVGVFFIYGIGKVLREFSVFLEKTEKWVFLGICLSKSGVCVCVCVCV